MLLRSLPPQVLEILAKYNAPPRLVAHLTVVHDVASALVGRLEAHWPGIKFDHEAVLIGAATHDIGKAIYTRELTAPGNAHEEIGPQLLLESGLSEAHARFARTHARWQTEMPVQFEDLLVAFTDTIWKGKRDQALEDELVLQIAEQCQEAKWDVYMQFDDMASEFAREAHARILWQGAQPI